MYIKIENSKGIVMSHCPKSLVDKFAEQEWKITEDYIIELTWDIIDALKEIHSHGIIHWDIKPENIMFSEDGEVQLIDFSYSRFFGKCEELSVAQNNTVFEGTIYYCARLQKGNGTFIFDNSHSSINCRDVFGDAG